jgi:hypothetical protein
MNFGGAFLSTWILAGVLAVSAFKAESARGQEPNWAISEIRLGLLGHDVDKLWSHFREESGVDYNSEIIFGWPSASLFSGTLRPNLGININNRGDTDKLYAGVLWEYEFSNGVFLNLGLGAAVHDGELETREDDKKQLGSRLLLRVPIEIGYSISFHHRISIAFDHVSNAYLATPNEGMDTLGLRYGYRF